MIDIENEILTAIHNACPTATVKKPNQIENPTFPCITVREKTNTTVISSVDTSGEYHSDITFEINIFSNSQTPILETKSFRATIDNILSASYGMNRVFDDEVPNYADSGIYRYVLKYQCIIDKNGKIYRG